MSTEEETRAQEQLVTSLDGGRPVVTTVYLGGDKHETTVFASPIAAVRFRIEEIYEHLDDPRVVEEAGQIVASGDQSRAWRFLQSRSDMEYEEIERYEVID